MVTGSMRLGPLSDCTANCRPVLSSEREPYRNKAAKFRQEVISGSKFQSGLDILTDRRSLSNFDEMMEFSKGDFALH
jgi:hypothetical protein